MATVVFAGCTGGMGQLLFQKLNAVASAPSSFLKKPIRHLILIDYFKDENGKKSLRDLCNQSIVRVDVLHWDACNEDSTIELTQALDRLVPASTLIDLTIITTGMGFHGEVNHMNTAQSGKILLRLLRVNAVGPSLLVQHCAKKIESALQSQQAFLQTSSNDRLKPAVTSMRAPTILLLSSFSGVVGLPHRAAYCSSKFALNGYVEALAAECPAVRYVMICPTSVATAFRDNWKKQLKESEGSQQHVEVNSAQMTAEQCVDEIWKTLVKDGKAELTYEVLPRGKSEIAFMALRLPFGIGAAIRRRIYKASSKL